MTKATTMKLIHSARVVTAFALFGAVLTGVATGWVDHPPFDLRAAGAVIGATGAIIVQALHA